MRESYLSHRMEGLKPSPIRKFFDIVATMKDVISLGIGEPDFDTPKSIIRAGVRSLPAAHSAIVAGQACNVAVVLDTTGSMSNACGNTVTGISSGYLN